MTFRYRWKHKDGSIVQFSEKGSRTDDPGKDAWLNKMSMRNSHSPVLTLGIKIWLQRNCQLVESGGLDEAHNLKSFPVNRGNEFDRPEAAGITDDVDGYLFRSARRKTGQFTTNPLFQQDAHRIIRRRTKATGVETRIGNHTFRATGITAYLKNSGKLEVAQQIANHESPRTTKLYDRRQDEISLDEIERITI
jgi:Phage integrase family